MSEEETGFYLETTDFDKKFEALVRSVGGDVAAEGLFAAGQALLDAAQDQAPQTPYKEGDLWASREVKDPEVSEERISVEAGFNSKYAAYQHEGQRKEGTHKVKNYTKTQISSPGPKFLEKKMAGNAQRFMAVCADRIRRKLGGSPR